MSKNNEPQTYHAGPPPSMGFGGCASPVQETITFNAPIYSAAKTLRDEFAMVALSGLTGAVIASTEDSIDEWLAARSYEIADAMLAERMRAK